MVAMTRVRKQPYRARSGRHRDAFGPFRARRGFGVFRGGRLFNHGVCGDFPHPKFLVRKGHRLRISRSILPGLDLSRNTPFQRMDFSVL